MTKKQIERALDGFADNMLEAGAAMAETRKICRDYFKHKPSEEKTWLMDGKIFPRRKQ